MPKRVIFLSAVFLFSLSVTQIVNAQTSNWQLVWSDEFDYNGPPDPSKWTYETGFVRNQELQWYQPQNAFCKDGLLVIEGRREKVTNPNWDPRTSDWRTRRRYADYTSASVTTSGLHSWQYGRFEMRGKIDTSMGLWPAFWSLGISRPWPHCGEVDIMEYYTGSLLANVAWGDVAQWTAIWDSTKTPITSFNDPDWSSKFHIWRMDWDEQEIKLYVDDILLNTTDLNQTFNRDAEGINPLRQPHYIILNLAIGSTGGNPKGTSFPRRFEIDYVRIYQK